MDATAPSLHPPELAPPCLFDHPLPLCPLAKTAPGSGIVVSYLIAEPLMEDAGRAMLDRFGRLAASVGEPFHPVFTPDEAEACMRRCGLEVVDPPPRADVEARYFAARPDGLAPITFEQLLTVTIPG